MDFAVNQRADGLYVYRIYDDFWFQSHDPTKCAAAWREMKTFADLVGISFNMTGSFWGQVAHATLSLASNLRKK